MARVHALPHSHAGNIANYRAPLLHVTRSSDSLIGIGDKIFRHYYFKSNLPIKLGNSKGIAAETPAPLPQKTKPPRQQWLPGQFRSENGELNERNTWNLSANKHSGLAYRLHAVLDRASITKSST